MRPTSTAIAALCAALSLSDLARASLKHTHSEAFVKLADLTRTPEERLAARLTASSFNDKSSFDFEFVREGVDWQISYKEDDVCDLVTGQNNDNGLNLQSLGMHFEPRDNQPTSGKSKRSNWFHSIKSREFDDRTDNGKQKVRTQGGQKTPSTFSPLTPPSIPLAVKSPYLSAWAPAGSLTSVTPPNTAGNGGYLAGQFPGFWTTGYSADGDFRLGWNGFIRVDNTTYQWLGDSFGSTVRDGPDARQISFAYTATRSIFAFEAGGVYFNVTFMTPVWPNDYVRQSLPMSYMHVELDRQSVGKRSVQLYTDIDERWSTAHVYDYENYPINMTFVDAVSSDRSETSTYFVQRTKPQEFVEFRQRAEWGSAVYAMRKRPGMSSRNNNNIVTQRQFLDTGSVQYDHLPVGGPDNSFSYTVDFNNKTGGNDALFGIGHMRMPYVQYIRRSSAGIGSYLENRYGYWMSKYPRYEDAVAFFMSDFENALEHCKALDAKIESDSRAAVGGGQIGEMYAAITTLSVRQSMAATEITVPYNEQSGRFDSSDPIIFVKEISSDGDIQTVDVFTPQFPILSYLNPELLHDVMKPIFQYTESGLYPNKWCVHDLGFYPNATGHNDGKDEPMQVEESGNMILLSLHYAQMVDKSSASSFLQSHYKILQQWAQFLMQDSLIPALQLSTDDFAGTLANQTNLALKGIEGIAAMEHIAQMVGRSEDAAQYRNVSQTYIQAYYGYAFNSNNTHIKLAYQDDNSWGTLYNLAFDKLLNLKLVAKELYTKQDAFYPTKANAYGTPLDSRYSWAKTDWQMWASATAASDGARDFWIKNLHKFVSDVKTDAPLTDLYETSDGDFPKEPKTPKIYFIARPVVGGHLIHLAMKKANQVNGVSSYEYGPAIRQQNSTSTSSSTTKAPSSPSNSLSSTPTPEKTETPAQSSALGIIMGLLDTKRNNRVKRLFARRF